MAQAPQAWRLERELERREALREAFEALFALACKPEKLLLFALYVLLQEEYLGGKKQYLKWLAAALRGQELFDLFAQVKHLLQPLALGERCYAPLEAALHQPCERAPYGSRCFAEETRTLVMWISNLHARMRRIASQLERAHIA